MRICHPALPAAALLIGSVAATAPAATFSFASDSYGQGPTWTLADNMLAAYNGVQVDLLVDVDEDGPNDAVVFPEAQFDALITLSYETSIPMGGLFLHVFSAEGWASWTDSNGAGLLLHLDFFDAAFTALGTSLDSIGSAASLFGSDFSMGAVAYTPGQPLIDLGLPFFTDPQDFAFTLTDINDGMGTSLLNGMLGAAYAEGSFSGSAIPAPGSLALIGLGTLVLMRRRR